MAKHATIPAHQLQNREWRAALILLQNTTLNEFLTTEYVDFELNTIDFDSMRQDAATHSQRFLAGLAAHLFDPFIYNMPGHGMFSLDDRNRRYAFLAMMVRYGVNPAEIVSLMQNESFSSKEAQHGTE